ncbi:hypothetical protein ACGFX4_31770 [Kitasatospora sp. NPDC048365]|uniref:hypothetical protein n=1 Tax=Kitasatospora sp. NPDC048365 TaxID=3364050 RepID=UPI0037205424
MHRLARYLLVWICCTAFAVTAVFFAVGFVVDSTAEVPPTVRTGADGIGTAVDGIGTAASAVAQSPSAAPVPSGPPSAAPSSATPGGPPSAGGGPSPTKTRVPTPSGTPTPTPQGGDQPGSCPGGPGVYTVKSEGGQVTVRYGASAVCLVSALPAPGFTTQTAQGSAQTLQVTFTSSQHRSQITSTVQPRAQSSVRETDL